MAAGVLCDKQIRKFIDDSPNVIVLSQQISIKPGPSEIDLPLGHRAYQVPATCRPNEKLSVEEIIQQHKVQPVDLIPAGTCLKKNTVYLVETDWTLKLPDRTFVKATARSSIGRLDVLVRLIADRQREFDVVANDSGPVKLFVEVIPLTFGILVSPGRCLSQLRFIRGAEQFCTVPAEALTCEEAPVLVDGHGQELTPSSAEGDRYGVLLHLELENDTVTRAGGFVAKTSAELDGQRPIDPWARKPKNGGNATEPRHDPRLYWDTVVASEQKTVLIEKNRFYIFRSKERFRLPPHLALDCQAYSESLGDIRIHYAGFAHPYFGLIREDGRGTPLIFEVRGHSTDTLLRDGDALAKAFFRRMSQPPDKPSQKGEYDSQELKLSGCFRDWEPE